MLDSYEILLPEEVMEYLDIGRNTVYKLLSCGEIRGFRVGRKWKIPRKELDAYIDRSVRG